MNPLDGKPRLRKRLYDVQFVVAGLLLLIAVGLAAADVPLPKWYIVTTAVANALWSYTGLTASSHVQIPEEH